MRFPTFALLLPALFACHATDEEVHPDPPAPEWILLDSAEHWRGYKSESIPDAWTIEDGVIALDGSGGDLITREQFEDFALELEWRISERGNSGIFYRATEETGVIYENAAEMQVLDNAGTGTEPTSVHAAGANYALHGPPADFSKPAGEWNHVRIVCEGPNVKHFLNGNLVCDYDMGSEEWNELVAASKFAQWPPYGQAMRGHIGLQDHGNAVWYRNARILVLD